MWKGLDGVKGGVFKKSQRHFLLSLFNNNGGPKIKERDTQIRMVVTFKDKDEDSDFSLRLVLSESQIKSWFSSEGGCRKKTTMNREIEEGFTELNQSVDIQDNEEGGHDQNKGVFLKSTQKKKLDWCHKICVPYGQHIPVSRGFSKELDDVLL